MKPTPEMIEAACEAYISRSSMNMGDCMSEALEAALSAMWQPIETAPKDGTLFLVHCAQSIYHPQAHCCFWMEDYDDDYGEWVITSIGTGEEYCEIQPTHWMPMPGAPETT